MKKKPQGGVINEHNIQAVLQQLVEYERRQPIDRIQPCARCPKIMGKQPAALLLIDGKPHYLCDECAKEA